MVSSLFYLYVRSCNFYENSLFCLCDKLYSACVVSFVSVVNSVFVAKLLLCLIGAISVKAILYILLIFLPDLLYFFFICSCGTPPSHKQLTTPRDSVSWLPSPRTVPPATPSTWTSRHSSSTSSGTSCLSSHRTTRSTTW